MIIIILDAKGFVFDSATAVQTIAKDPTWEDMVTFIYIFERSNQRIARPFSNWARSYHDRLSKKWATILSRSFSQKVSQIRSWNFTIWSGSFPIIFKEYQKEQFRIYPNKAQNLEKNILFFLKKYILRFGFIKKI